MDFSTDKIKNIAIIAHVDHGKTTLIDGILKQTQTFRANEDAMTQTTILDNNTLERERGITILAKNTSVHYKGYKINIIDTPGHSDFGGEVERVLSMADGAILLVDAQEGAMPQTKFVLKNALRLGLKVIVCINKIDKRFADIAKTTDSIHNLFLELATDDSSLDFPVLYSISREGKCYSELPTPTTNDAGDLLYPDATLQPLLDKILEIIPSPIDKSAEPFLMQVSNIDYDPHLGSMVVGRVLAGEPKVGMSILMQNDDVKQQGKITKLYVTDGLKKVTVEKATCGDIVSISGIKEGIIGATIGSLDNKIILPKLDISEPSIKIKFEPNTSPLAGKEGKFVTSRQILERLQREMLTNVAMKLEILGESEFIVAGRGELHLSILIETLRREGFEFQVSKPEVILKEVDGVKCEPQEILYIDVPSDYIGNVTSELAARKAEMVSMDVEPNGNTVLCYKIRTKAGLGLRNEILTLTKGTAVINSFFDAFVPFIAEAEKARKGVLISMETGKVFNYAIEAMQERGTLFVRGQDDVYEGMIVGINKFDNDIEVNPCREKHKTGVRIAHIEIDTSLTPPIDLTLEYALTFLKKFELLEVTPSKLRLRKKYLTKTQRVVAERGGSEAAKAILN